VARNPRLRIASLLSLFAAVLFSAGCGDDNGSSPPQTGTLGITTVTTGDNTDADGYTFSVNGGASQAIGINATASVPNMSPGSYTVVLSGVAANCTVDAASKTATVTAGATATVTFNIACVSETGDVEVTVATTGSNLDPDGYTVTIGTQSEAVDANDTVTFTDLPAGGATVLLGGVASNCTADAASKNVTVVDGQTAQVDFAIVCSATVGAIEVTAATTGNDIDADGYTVTVSADARPIAVDGTVLYENMAPATYDVVLSDLAANCTADQLTKSAVVIAGDTASVSFAVACDYTTGSLEVTAVTTGTQLDPDGYTITVDGTTQLPVPTNGSVTFNGLSIGNHTVAISGLAANCQVTDGQASRTVDVAGGPNQTTFTLSCFQAASGRILFHTNRDGNFEIYSMNQDGTNKVRLTNSPQEDLQPSPSPNGLYIAFWSRRDGNAEIYIMGADGSGQTNISNQAGDDMMPSWSPDGTRIAYQRKTSTSQPNIWVMSVDGTNKRQLTSDDGTVLDDGPSWVGPQKIAFTSDRTGDQDVWVMNDDGTNPVNLTNFSAGVDCGPGSTDPTRSCRDSRPNWNGLISRYVYDANHAGDAEIWTMLADGSAQTRLLSQAGNDFEPRWSPSGARIVFTGALFGNDDVFIMNADGSGVAPLTNNPAGDGGGVFVP
jgi:Tol biopolymer transport system component